MPGFLPDTPDVRNDLLDYYFEVQRFDRDLGAIIAALERAGELENTIVIVTSDNGMPFPRAKANVYDAGARVPLAIRWPGVAQARRGDRLVRQPHRSRADAAGRRRAGAARRRSPAARCGRCCEGSRSPDAIACSSSASATRTSVKGILSYPVRAIRTKDYLYIRNFRPDRWPAGDPQQYVAVGPFGDIDGGPSKSLLLDRQTDPSLAPFFQLATAKRPAEELYDLRRDPDQLKNVAGQPAHRAAQQRLRAGTGSLAAQYRRSARDRRRRPLGSIPLLRGARPVSQGGRIAGCS